MAFPTLAFEDFDEIDDPRYVYDADIPWWAGSYYNYDSGYWGFAYLKDPEKDQFDSYFNINTRQYKMITGAYVEGGQRVYTMIGRDLGVDYSPYIANLEKHVLGLRVLGYRWNALGFGRFDIDTTTILGYSSSGTVWRINTGKPDFAVNVTGNLLKLNLNGTMLRLYDDTIENYYTNYVIGGNIQLIPRRLTLQGIYGQYEKNKDWFYEVNVGLNLIPGALRFDGAIRDSRFVNVDDPAVRGPDGKYVFFDKEKVVDYLLERDKLLDVSLLGKSFNLGPTINFNLMGTSNMLKIEYASVAPPYTPPPLDPQTAVILETNYDIFSFRQHYVNMIPERENAAKRQFYRFQVIAEPQLDLPYGFRATLRFNFDYDKNYREESLKPRSYSQLGLQLATARDILRFKNVKFDGFCLLEREVGYVTEPFKYGWMVRYDAPNGVKFRIQYFNSKDFKDPLLDPFGNDRYKVYRWYRNDAKVQGWRIVLGIPF